ncbi:MAG: hypothetical protein ACLR4Z_07805 [Butyricicoccaceae bacterium]
MSAALGKLLDKAEQKVTVVQENLQGERNGASVRRRGGGKMTFSEQLKRGYRADRAGARGLSLARDAARATTAFSRLRNIPRWQAASACVR